MRPKKKSLVKVFQLLSKQSMFEIELEYTNLLWTGYKRRFCVEIKQELKTVRSYESSLHQGPFSESSDFSNHFHPLQRVQNCCNGKN